MAKSCETILLEGDQVSKLMFQKIYWTGRKLAGGFRRDFLLPIGPTIYGLRRFWQDFDTYQKFSETKLEYRRIYPIVHDWTMTTPIDPVYLYQDAWAFEHIVRERPEHHVDVGSHHKYVVLLSKIVPVTMVDIRPLTTPVNTLHFQSGSILDLPFQDGSIPSVSSMCVIEHIGLGRYGDPLDPNGTEKALAELKRIVTRGGNLYLSVPLDDENRIYFNAHRAFREDYLLSLFKPFRIMDRKYIFDGIFGDELRSGFGVGCYWLRNDGP